MDIKLVPYVAQKQCLGPLNQVTNSMQTRRLEEAKSFLEEVGGGQDVTTLTDEI
jgi:hypothetical protein